MKVVVIAALFTLGCGSAATAGPRFDLACTGVLREAPPGGGPFLNARETWTSILHVDLAKGLFCEDQCVSTARIARVDPDRFVFVDIDRADFDADLWSEHLEVGRADGAYSRVLVTTNRSIEQRRGTCTIAPLTTAPGNDF